MSDRSGRFEQVGAQVEVGWERVEEGKGKGRGASTGALDNQEEEGKHGAVSKHGRGETLLHYQAAT